MIQSSSNGLSQSTGDNSKNGLIERVVENWLTNATERGYQIAFCQMLASEGEQLLYIATHGAFEKGKDVVTRLFDASVRAYQLKGGSIRLSEWRSISEQINNLVELPVNLPQLNNIGPHHPYLVTNGRVDDVVLDYINTANLGWKLRGCDHPLQVIEGAQLVSRFVAAHGSFLPHETKDFKLFLTLVLNDGRAPLDKRSFSQLLESVIPFKEDTSEKNIIRALSSAVLLTSYILGASEGQANHWAIFEAWTMVASYVLGAATKFELADKSWKSSYDLAMLGARRALDSLANECSQRQEFIEGQPIADGFFYSARQLILAGLLSARVLQDRLVGQVPDPAMKSLIQARVKESRVWGESAAPFILLVALEMERGNQQLAAENWVLQYVQYLLISNEDSLPGTPDSFISVEDSLRFIHGMDDHDIKTSHGFSYSCQLCVDYLARRWRRQALSRFWPKITRLSFVSSIPQSPWEWFIWEASSARLVSMSPGQPQSWKILGDEAKKRDTSTLPRLLRTNPEFVLFYLLVFPHRLTSETLRIIDDL
jgi:hypothetical protein